MKITSKVILAATVLAVAAPVSTPVFASGGGGYSGGGSGSGTYDRAPRDPAQANYRKGRSYFKKYVTCKKCSYSKGVNDSATARKIMKQVRSGEIAVKSSHKEKLLYYIARRYRV